MASPSETGAVLQAMPPAIYIRQQDILPVDVMAKANVTIIGCGAVGSMMAVNLAKMGLGNLTLYDDDLVEPHNLPVQFYRVSDLGQFKVMALKSILEAFGCGNVTAINRSYAAQPVEGIVLSAVDSMDARMRIWKALKVNRKVRLHLDARMGAEVGKILAVNPSDPMSVATYEEELYPSKDAFHAPCTARATTYCASGLAALVAAKVGKVLLGRPYRRQVVIDFRQAVMM